MKLWRMFSLKAVVLACVVPMTGVQAQEVYGGAGIAGLQIGYAHALNSKFSLRADILTLGSRSQSVNNSGTQYQAKVEVGRTALLADWFPFETSGFRLSGGATINNTKAGLTASGVGKSVEIDGTTYTLGAGDSLNVQVKMPSTTPYLGLGWGHRMGNKGWGFHADVGVAVGKFKLTETRAGQLANGGAFGVTQANMDKELKDIRNNLNKVGVFPQVTLGVSYSF